LQSLLPWVWNDELAFACETYFAFARLLATDDTPNSIENEGG